MAFEVKHRCEMARYSGQMVSSVSTSDTSDNTAWNMKWSMSHLRMPYTSST